MLCLHVSTEYTAVDRAGGGRRKEKGRVGRGDMGQGLVSLKSLENTKLEYGLSGCYEGMLVKGA